MDKDYKKLNQFVNNINYYLNLNYKIILIYPIPQFSENVSQILHKLYMKDKINFFQNIQFDRNHIKLDLENYKNDTKKITDEFDNLNHKNLYKVFPQKIFCNENECNANSSKDIYFIDGSHLSKKGAEMINIDLMSVISKIQF